jgi:hypothetical protein
MFHQLLLFHNHDQKPQSLRFTRTQRRWRDSHLLDIVVAKGSAILQLLAGKDQTLLVWWDALLVLNLGLDIVDSIGRLDLEGDGLAREGLDEATRRISMSPAVKALLGERTSALYHGSKR